MTFTPQFEILNSFDDSIAIIESNGDIVFTNSAWKQFSISNSGDFIKTNEGTNYLDVCNTAASEGHSLSSDAYRGILKVINRELDVFEMEYPCHSDSESRWFILRVTSIEGFTNLTLLSHINITKRKMSEELVDQRNNQLNEINSRLETSIYKLAHDIQGPLNSVQGLVNISKTEKSILELKQYLALIDKSVLKLKEFIQGTLKFAYSDFKNESIDFATIFEELYESIRYNETLKVAEIISDIKQSDNHFNNKTEVKSIISNLISNSLKYYDPKKEKPVVIVSIITKPKEARISIKDNGIGIGTEFLSKIFDLNFQIRKDSNEGAGLGLHIVAKAVELLKGQLNIHSKLGEGTEINIILPNMNSSVNVLAP